MTKYLQKLEEHISEKQLKISRLEKETELETNVWNSKLFHVLAEKRTISKEWKQHLKITVRNLVCNTQWKNTMPKSDRLFETLKDLQHGLNVSNNYLIKVAALCIFTGLFEFRMYRIKLQSTLKRKSLESTLVFVLKCWT